MKYFMLVVAICSTIVAGFDSSVIAREHHTLKKQDTVITSNDVVAKDTLRSSNVNESSGDSTELFIGFGLIILFSAIFYFRRRNRTEDEPIDFYKSQRESESNKSQELPNIEVDTINSVIKSLEQELGLLEESISYGQKKLVGVLLRSLDTYHESAGKICFSGIDGEKDKATLKKMIVQAVIERGGLIEFLQTWVIGTFKNEVVLLGASKIGFRELMADISHDCFDETTDEYSPQENLNRIEPLTTIFPIEHLRTYCNGHELEWHLNESFRRVQKNLMNWSFAKNFVKIKPEELFDTVFTDTFFREKVYRATSETVTEKHLAHQENKVITAEDITRMSQEEEIDFVEDYVNISDVEYAQEQYNSKPKQIAAQKEEYRKSEEESNRRLEEQKSQLLSKMKTSSSINTSEIKDKPINILSYDEIKKKTGRIYQGYLETGVPLASIKEGRIYKGFVDAGYPLGTLKNGKLCPGFIEGGVPIALIVNHKIYKGFAQSYPPLATMKNNKIYPSFLESGYPIATYVGNNPDDGLAAAFLVGLLDK